MEGNQISVYTLWVKMFDKIALSCVLSEINMFSILHRNSRWPPKMGENNVFETVADDSVNTLRVQNFAEIALSRTISEISMFLLFT